MRRYFQLPVTRSSRGAVLAAAVSVVLGAACRSAPPALPSSGSVVAVAREEEVAVVATPYGEIVWRFLPAAAPGHVEYVRELITRRFYDGTTLHRVIPRFVVQGGDPNSRDQDRANDGEGQADRTLTGEFSTTLHYRAGTVGMARSDDPNSGSCQFFIAIEDLPRLDGKYTIFGEVIEGLEVARRIAALPRDLADNPLERVAVTVRIERRPVPELLLSSSAAAASGELLTGPDKPQPWRRDDPAWTAPRLLDSVPADAAAPRLELAIDADGRVIDVRFPAVDTANPAEWMRRAFGWRFAPALQQGRATKVRLEIDGDGSDLGPPR